MNRLPDHRRVIHGRTHPVMADVMAMHCAMAYEAGWLAYSPDAPGPEGRTPYADGWWDRFAALERGAECALGLDCIDEERDDDR